MLDTATQHIANTPEASSQPDGVLARAIEKQMANLPSDIFLWAAAGAIGASACLELTGHREKSRFIGQWVSPFLLLGVYNKLVRATNAGHQSEVSEKQ